MKKYEILKTISDAKVVAVVRVNGERAAFAAAEALAEGGIRALELTFTVPHAHTILEKLAVSMGDKLSLGAGTVLDAETARIAILSGAQYLIAPSLDLSVVAMGNRYGVPVIPTITNATEAVAALSAGADLCKLFPARLFPPATVKALKAPLPNLELMPTGGIDESNVRSYIEAGALACGVGGSLLKGLAEGKTAEITQRAKRLIEAANGR